MTISYHHWYRFQGWQTPQIEEFISSRRLRQILEVGAGCNPSLSPEMIAREGLRYTILDHNAEELAKGPPGYEKWCADIGSPACEIRTGFDLIFSRMVAEHVENARQMHENIFRMLAPGGYALHYFPTLYSLPFVANRLLSEPAAGGLMDRFAPRDRVKHGKFKAYYHGCRGPTRASVAVFEKIGFTVVEYDGYFGHGYYEKLPALRFLHRAKTALLEKHPVAALTSYARVLLRKGSES
jgi:SAM-dependent methyltransferase